MTELETKKAIEEQSLGRAFQETECLKQIAINLARIVDRLDCLDRTMDRLCEIEWCK